MSQLPETDTSTVFLSIAKSLEKIASGISPEKESSDFPEDKSVTIRHPLGKDKFRIDPSKRPHLRRLIRKKGNTPEKRLCWELTSEEIEDLYKVLSSHVSDRLKKECM